MDATTKFIKQVQDENLARLEREALKNKTKSEK